ncbi:MAG: acylphosphatase [Deltaproteobacteria bacterium]|nr:acylphosphatase [Deltaproteobacteria bacterium]MBI3296307.1 acylphosphatase [Deltaproteobacteria bacterium]
MLVKVHILIHGQVQGVGFRHFTARKASHIRVVGWVRNLPDGRVEVLAEGDEKAIAEFEKWCSEGPSGAGVDKTELVEKTPIAAFSFTGFEIRK